MLKEVGPTLKELGILTPEEMGYDKPELAVKDVYDMQIYHRYLYLQFIIQEVKPCGRVVHHFVLLFSGQLEITVCFSGSWLAKP